MSTEASDGAEASDSEFSAEPEVIDPSEFVEDPQSDESTHESSGDSETVADETPSEDVGAQNDAGVDERPADEADHDVVEVDNDPQDLSVPDDVEDLGESEADDEDREEDDDGIEGGAEPTDPVETDTAEDEDGEHDENENRDEESEVGDDPEGVDGPSDEDSDDDDGAGGAGAASRGSAAAETESVGADQTGDSQSEAPDTGDESSAHDADLMESQELSISSFPTEWEAETTARHVQTIIDTLRGFMEEAKVYLMEDGLIAKGVDPEMAGIVEARLNSTGYDAYEADRGVFGVPLDRFKEAVSMASSKDSTVAFSLDAESRDLTIAVDDVKYTLGLVQAGSVRDPPSIDDLDLRAGVEMEAGELKWALNGLDIIADKATLSVDADQQAFEMEGADHAQNAGYTLGADEDPMVNFEPGDAESCFDINRLKKTQRGIPSKRTPVKLALGNDFPVKVAYEFCDGDGSCLVMLAPLIED